MELFSFVLFALICTIATAETGKNNNIFNNIYDLLIIKLIFLVAASRLRVFTVATDTTTDGFVRFNRSANVYGLKVEVIIGGYT